MSTVTAPTSARPNVKGFYDPRTFSIQYVVSDPATKTCAVIDPVLDFDERSGSTAAPTSRRVIGERMVPWNIAV